MVKGQNVDEYPFFKLICIELQNILALVALNIWEIYLSYF